MKANVTFDPNAKCPKWEKFFSDILLGNEGIMDFIQRADGYSLTGDTDEQLMFMCIGDGANGKSTYLNVKRDILGDYSKAAPFATFSAKNRSDMTNDLARLMGARYVTIIESDEDACLAEAKIKQATGGDPIPCRFLRKEFFEYIPQFKIWMAANRLPIIKGTDHGNFRRMIVLPFNRRFSEAERVPDMQEQLFAERAGILNWMLAGLAKWQRQRLSVRMPEEISSAKNEYQDDMDITGRWLAAHTRQADSSILISSDDLYQDYHQYVRSVGHYPKSSTLWGREMKNRFEWKRDSKGIKYKGIVLSDAEWPVTSKVEKGNYVN
jgi:putative DNA primase/helicase